MDDLEEQIPEDLDEGNYIAIPHKNDLDLGRALVFRFVREQMPDYVDKVILIFNCAGAYARYKTLLHKVDMLDQWYEYEQAAHEQALRAWCDDCGIDASG